MVELTVLVEFVALQRRLVASLLSLYPEITRNELLLGTPFKVELCMDAQMWDVSRHGVGVMFRRRDPKPNLVVDVHVEIQNPNRLDAWRLQQFVESKGAVLEFPKRKRCCAVGSGQVFWLYRRMEAINQ